MTTTAAIWAAVAIAALATDLQLLVRRVVMVNQGIRVTCKVPRDARNRSVTLGFSEWTRSTRPLEGENSKITHDLYLDRIPCDPGDAFCTLTRADAPDVSIHLTVTVAGCREVDAGASR